MPIGVIAHGADQGSANDEVSLPVNELPKEAWLFLDCDMTEEGLKEIAGGVAAVYSARCPGKETPNEDAAGLIPFDEQSGILVVADGLGGAAAGDRAANLAVTSMKTSAERGRRDGAMLRTAILDGFEAANRSILELGMGAATTLAVVEIQNGTVRPYHVGDSMILAVGQRGKIKLQTTSHSPVGFAVEAGLLDEKDAIHHEDRHVVSNVVGSTNMKIEIGSPLRLARRDTVLVASDGLSDNLHVEETIQRARKGGLREAVQRLSEDARRRMNRFTEDHPSKPDDLTFILFRMSAP